MQRKNATIDQAEIAQFAKDSAHWWDEHGPFAPLHRLNPARMAYIRDTACAHFERETDSLNPLKGLKIIDVGCGGGLVCEPLARMGAKVTGIDADEQAIAVARDHAEKAGLEIEYLNASTGDLLSPSFPRKRESRGAALDTRLRGHDGRGFDVVLALEIAEHVADVDKFVDECVDLCRPGGLIVFSTLNRTAKSFILGIVAAEYLLRWVPRGTHNWKKFIRPSELARCLRNSYAEPFDEKGLIFNPLTGEFSMSETDIDVNYFMSARKP